VSVVVLDNTKDIVGAFAVGDYGRYSGSGGDFGCDEFGFHTPGA
jgi:hypothetical protein